MNNFVIFKLTVAKKHGTSTAGIWLKLGQVVNSRFTHIQNVTTMTTGR